MSSTRIPVGREPEMMPMIVTVTLARGACRMARKKVLVKQLVAIEDFGSVEILCSDKTGTLTEGEIVLDRHVDVLGKDDDDVLRFNDAPSLHTADVGIPVVNGVEVAKDAAKIILLEKDLAILNDGVIVAHDERGRAQPLH